MVRNIVNVVEDKCEEGRFPGLDTNPPSALSSRIRAPGVGFDEAKRIVKQTIAE